MKRIHYLFSLFFFLSWSLTSFGQILTEDFEGAFPTTGWSIAKNSGNDWTQNTTAGNGGGKCAQYAYNSSNAADSWLFTSGVALTAGDTYSFSFYQKVASGTWPEKMKFTVGTAATIADQTTTLLDLGTVTNTSYAQHTGTFTPSVSGTYYFAFHCYSDANQYNLYVDDLEIYAPVVTPPNCETLSTPSDAATDINVTTNLTWAAATGLPTGYKIDLGTTTGGTDILNDYDAGLVTTYDLPTDLTYNTTYYATVKPYNGNGSATGCTETSFTTKDGCIAPYTPSNGSTTADPNQTISWSSYTGATGYIVSIGTTAGGTDILNAHDNGTSTSYAVSGLSYSTQYYVSIKAENANGLTSATCNTYEFTTKADPTLIPPFVEAFASYPATNWTEAKGQLAAPTSFTSTSSNWTNGNFGNTGSNVSAYMNIYSTGRYEWFISPSINLGAGGTNYQLEFDLALTPWTGTTQTALGVDDKVAVVISTDDGVTWTSANTLQQWVEGDAISPTGDHIVIDLSAYSGTVKLGFYGESTVTNTDMRLYIDNIEVKEIPACPDPTNLATSSVMATTATATWDAAAGGAGYNWEIVPTGDGQGNNVVSSGNVGAVTTTSVTGLSAQTTYDLYIQTDCGSGALSPWEGPHTFTTPCAAFTAPYTQNFDGTTAPALDACWSTINSTGSSSVYARTSTSKANSTSNSLQLYNSFYTSGDLMAISPMFSDFDAIKRIRFYVYDDNNGANLVVGTMSDPTDAATFTAFQTITAADMDNDAWEQFTIDFTGYVGTDKYIAFKHDMASSYDYLYIDDFEYEEILANDAAVTTVTPPMSGCGLTATESVDVVITNNGSASIAMGAASVAITGAGNSPTAVTNTGSIAAGATETITVTGVDLSAMQSYTLTATVTLAGDGNAANNTGTGDVANVAVISSFPYTDDFESGVGAWTSGGTNNSWEFGTPADTDINSAASGSNAWMTGLTANYNDYEASYVLSPCFDFSSLTAPKVSLSVYTESESSYDGALLQYTIDNGATWVTVGDMTSGTNWYNDGTVSGLNWADAAQDGWTGTSTSAWATAEHSIATLGGESSVRFRIAFGSDSGSNDDGFAFDDFHIENVSCPDPTTLTTSSLTSTTVNLDWTEVGTATAWDIEWMPSGTAQGSGTMVTATSTKPYGLTGLTANTAYDFYVRSNCGGSTSGWTAVHTFTTLCDAVSDFNENFDGVGTGTLPSCWTELVVSSSVSADVETSTSYDQSAPNSVRFDPNNDASATLILVSPSLDNLGSAYRLNFNAIVSSTNMTYSVGTITDPNDAATFTALYTNETLTSSATAYAKSYDFSAYAGSDNFIAIKANPSTTYQYLYVDDMVWETLPVTVPNCATITTPVDASTDQSIATNFSWVGDIDATGYKLSIGTTSGGTDILNASDLGNVTTYDHASDLGYNTTYYVTLVAYNANGDATGCTETTFTTEANPNYGGGPDGMDPNQMNSGGYYFANSTAAASGASPSQPTYAWVDPVGAGHTEITSWTSGSDDDGYFTIPDIGFDFTFYGSTYRTSNVFISSNGIMTFGAGYTAGTATYDLPSTSGPGACIAGCYADLDDRTNGKIYYGGDATRFIATWVNYHDYSDDSEYITFQIILEASGRIIIQYNDALSSADELGDAGSTATLLGDALVGIQNSAEDKGIMYRNNGAGAPMFSSPLAVAFNTDNAALPVEMTSFTATAEAAVNVLTWETATEENNAYFNVERSANGIDFETIGQVEGHGTTTEVSNYNFIDEMPATVSYYRLNQVDFDGKSQNSNVVIVKRDRITNNEVRLYPVPVQDRLTVEYGSTANEDVNVTITDVTGRIVLSKVETAVEGENQFFVDFSNLPAGSYFVKLQSNTDSTVRSVVKK